MPKQGPKPNPWADHYTRQAKKENFAARSVYKLQEIQRRYRVIRRGARVLDLGCAPGSWLQYAAKLTGGGGTGGGHRPQTGQRGTAASRQGHQR